MIKAKNKTTGEIREFEKEIMYSDTTGFFQMYNKKDFLSEWEVIDEPAEECNLPNCKQKDCPNYGNCIEYCVHCDPSNLVVNKCNPDTPSIDKPAVKNGVFGQMATDEDGEPIFEIYSTPSSSLEDKCCDIPKKTISVSTVKGRRAICNNCGKDWEQKDLTSNSSKIRSSLEDKIVEELSEQFYFNRTINERVISCNNIENWLLKKLSLYRQEIKKEILEEVKEICINYEREVYGCDDVKIVRDRITNLISRK